jgi:hypothetical protein
MDFKHNIDEKLINLQAQLHDFKKLIPGTPQSILTAQDIKLLKERYLPILKHLMELGRKFADGEVDVFRTAPPAKLK